ncbi:MAG TPA: glycosyltransferase [Candidatus Dormibacteraeota bacterium]
MVEVLNSETPDSAISATYFSAAEIDDLAQLGSYLDVVVVCRAQLTNPLARLIARMKSCGVPVVYDLDDYVFDPDLAPLLIDTFGLAVDSEPNLTRWFSYCARIGAALRLCDAAFVTSEALGRELSRATGVPYSVVPNFVNQEQERESELIWRQKAGVNFGHGGSWGIGYFSGSPSHDRDFRMVSGALIALMKADPAVKLRVVGFLDPDPELLAFGDRVERIGLQDTLTLQWLVGEVDVSIAPLQDNVFTACKSDLKWFEPALVGTVVIASPAGTMGARIVDGQNGRVARSYEWHRVLREVIGDGESCRAIAQRARTQAIADCTPMRQRTRIRDALAMARALRRPGTS